MRRETGATVAIVVLAALLVGLAAWAPWHSPFSVDNRTYLDMIDGVRHHGLPAITNGPASEFVELRPRFHFVHDGQLWGQYPPAYAYVAAPAMAAGGVHLVFQLGVVLLAAAAIATFLLGREISGSAWTGAVASWVLVLATPTVASYYQTLAQPLLLTFLVLALHAVVRALRGGRHRWSAAAGGFAGLAAATHLVGFPMAVPVFGMLLVVAADRDGFVLRAPDRRAAARVAIALVPFALAVTPLVILNRVRWGGMNPLSYGPCIWHACNDVGKDTVTSGAILRLAVPAIIWAAALAISLVLARTSAPTARTKWLLVAALVAGLLALPVVRERVVAHLRLALAYVVSPSFLPLAWPLSAPPTNVGVMTDPFVLKSLLQCSPAFGIVLTAPFLRAPLRGWVVLLCAMPVGLFGALSLFANLSAGYALGFPFMFMRYCTPALPFLAVATAIILSELAANTRVVLLALVAIAVAVVAGKLLDVSNDVAHVQRLVLVRGTLLAAGASAAAVAYATRASSSFARPLAAMTVAAAVGLGVAIAALDARRMAHREADLDAHQDAFAAATPARFAVMGFPQDLDAVLPVRTWKDVEAADLAETTDWQSTRRLIDRWRLEARPVFVVTHDNAPFPPPWPDVRFEAADAAHGIYEVVVRPE